MISGHSVSTLKESTLLRNGVAADPGFGIDFGAGIERF